MEQIYIFKYTILPFLTQVSVHLELWYFSFWRLQFFDQSVFCRSLAVDCICMWGLLIRVCFHTVTQLITSRQCDHTQRLACIMHEQDESVLVLAKHKEHFSPSSSLSFSLFFFLSGTFYFASARLAVEIRLMLQFVNFNYGPLWTAPISSQGRNRGGNIPSVNHLLFFLPCFFPCF